MKRKFRLFSLLLIPVLLTVSCGNLFSILSPSDPEQVTELQTLIAMGQQELSALNYSNANVIFEKALTIDPNSAEALEGAATSYLFWKIPLTNFIRSALNGDFNQLTNGITGTDPLQLIYSVALYVNPKLDKINMGLASGIVSNDIGLNVNYFLFYTIQTVMAMVDLNDNGVFMNDLGDIMTFTSLNPVSFTNQFDVLSNNFIAMLGIAARLPAKASAFFNGMDRVESILMTLTNSLSSTKVQAALGELIAPISTMKTTIKDQLTNAGFESIMTNLTFSNIMAFIGISNVSLANASSNFIDILSNSGYAPDSNGYTALTNELAAEGLSTDPVQVMLTLFPELLTTGTDMTNSLSNYFGL